MSLPGTTCFNCGQTGHKAAACPEAPRRQNQPMGSRPTTRLPDRTGFSNQLRPQPGPSNQSRSRPATTSHSAGAIYIPDPTTSAKGPKVYTEADLISFGIQRREEQKALTTLEMAFEHGLRTDYGKTNDRPDECEIITNYVKINQRPKWVYVYKLYLVRERNPPQQDKVVKNRTEKGAVFEALKQRPGYVSLRDRKDYATDYDVIWATNPLFPDKAKGDEGTPVEALASQFTTSVLHPFTRQPIQWHSVKIIWEKRIDAQANVRSFSGGQNADIDDFTRGINAFMTQHARENATTNGYETTAANRFFLTQGNHQHELDASGNHNNRNDRNNRNKGNEGNNRALVALRGFTLSARPGTDEWHLNIHVGASPFIVGGKVHELFQNLRRMDLTPREVFSAFKNREVMINNPGSSPLRRVITELGNDQLQAKRTWSEFDIELASQNRNRSQLPVNVGPKGLNADIYIAENMAVQGLHPFRGILTSPQTTRMLDFACKLPVINKHHLEADGFGMFGISSATGQSRIANFGLAVDDGLLRIPARLLAPTRLLYSDSSKTGNTKSIKSMEAGWNLQHVHFFTAATTLKRVVIMDLNPSAYQQRLQILINNQLEPELQKNLRSLGMKDVIAEYHNDWRAASDPRFPGETELLRYFSRLPRDTSAVLVVLPEHHYDLYSSIKRVADLQLGRHVVCAVASKMNGLGESRGNQYLANVGMKFNLKGRGINHGIEQSHLQSIIHTRPPASGACRTIIIGADVAHPTSSARPGCPSIAAVVGSVDDNYLHYPGSMRLQLNRQEFIGDLRDMVKERLIDWAVKHQNILPANMLMYRDGVSESQYEIVRDGEIPQLQDAFNDAYEHLNPNRSAKSNPPKFKLTFVVVGKRHNTRFFTDNKTQDNSFLSDVSAADAMDDTYQGLQKEEDQIFKEKLDRDRKVIRDKYTRVNHNIKPGFVVDKVITHPYREDFFLQSHMPLKGTGRSAHYFVLTNQMRLNSDELQRVTHALCYIYARATKGVSYCAPAYYADRLCDRGRAWLREYLTGHRLVPQNKDEEFDAFKQRALHEIDNGPYWRPQPRTALNYGSPRRKPWHPNLDDVMFYL